MKIIKIINSLVLQSQFRTLETSVLQVNQPVTLYLTAYGRPTPVRFCMAGKINYEAVFPYVVRKRQQGVLP